MADNTDTSAFVEQVQSAFPGAAVEMARQKSTYRVRVAYRSRVVVVLLPVAWRAQETRRTPVSLLRPTIEALAVEFRADAPE